MNNEDEGTGSTDCGQPRERSRVDGLDLTRERINEIRTTNHVDDVGDQQLGEAGGDPLGLDEGFAQLGHSGLHVRRAKPPSELHPVSV